MQSATRSHPMVHIASPRDEMELLFLKSILDDAGVTFFVQNDTFGSLTLGPRIELYNGKRIFVPAEQAAEARELLSDFRSRAEEPEPRATAYTLGDKLRMLLEVLLFGWIMPGRRRRERGPHLRLVRGGLDPASDRATRRSGGARELRPVESAEADGAGDR